MDDNSFQQRSIRFVKSPVANGPLAKLYENPYDFTSRYYPRNLGSAARGHYINFYINVAQNSQYKEQGKYRVYEDVNGRTAINQAGGKTVTSVNLKDSINSAANTVGLDVELTNDVTLARRTKRISTAIALYMPETMNVQYNSDWQSANLTEAGGKLLAMGQAGKTMYDAFKSGDGDLKKAFKSLAANPTTYNAALELAGNLGTSSGILGSGATDFLLAATGVAVNPQLEVLFKGLDMRTFQFDFMFAPYDEQEAQNVLEIIKTFKFHMAPEISDGMMGRYFIPPSEFDIDFLYDGQINRNVHQVGTCVLKDVAVDYAPNGWSTFGNGMPTHIKLSLQFMETEIVTKQRIEQDNY